MARRHMKIPEFGDFTVVHLLVSAYVGKPVPRETVRRWRKKFHMVPDKVVSQNNQLYDARSIAIMLLLGKHMVDGFYIRDFDTAYNLGVLEARITSLIKFGFYYESIEVQPIS
jgi:hypothetical protein